jgi:hypothetical protein
VQGTYRELASDKRQEGTSRLGRSVLRGLSFSAIVLVALMAMGGNFVAPPRVKRAAYQQLAMRPMEEVQFRVPAGTAPGSVIHIVVPGDVEPRAVEVPATASAGEMLAVRVPPSDQARKHGTARSRIAAAGPTPTKQPKLAETAGHGEGKEDDVIEEVEEVVEEGEMTVTRYILLILTIAAGLWLIGNSVTGIVNGFGALEVDPRRVIDHPCRWTDDKVREQAAEVMAQRTADGTGSGASTPRLESARTGKESPRSSLGGSARDVRAVRATGRGEHLTAKETQSSERATAALQKEGEAMRGAAPANKAAQAAPVEELDEPPVGTSSSLFAELVSSSIQQEVGGRLKWLVALMLLQSVASFILHQFRDLLAEHLVVALYLMLVVGAGGNAGAQSVARSIEEVTRSSDRGDSGLTRVVKRQSLVALYLSPLLGLVMFALVSILHGHDKPLSIGLSTACVVFVSIMMGAVAPYVMKTVEIDVYHSAAAIQVAADVVGVLITCLVCSLVFSDRFFG